MKTAIIIKQSVFFLYFILCIVMGNAFCQTSSDHDDTPVLAKAVSIDNIKSVGIIANGGQRCDETSPVDVFADSILTDKIGSIANHSVVRYDRLSVLTGMPYWAPRRQYALSDGEKFKIYSEEITGWIDDKHLMTFSSAWRERNTDLYIAIDRNTVICLYSSGQHETPGCVAMAIWERINFENIWLLQTVNYDPMNVGLYTLPRIDGLVRYNRDDLVIQVSARGGDAGDAWGSYAFFLYQEKVLTKSMVKNYSYSSSSNYTRQDCELFLNEKSEPVVRMIQEHYVVDSSDIDDYRSSLSATDTTLVHLLDLTE